MLHKLYYITSTNEIIQKLFGDYFIRRGVTLSRDTKKILHSKLNQLPVSVESGTRETRWVFNLMPFFWLADSFIGSLLVYFQFFYYIPMYFFMHHIKNPSEGSHHGSLSEFSISVRCQPSPHGPDFELTWTIALTTRYVYPFHYQNGETCVSVNDRFI